MKDKLIKVWKTLDTKDLALIFEGYMKNIGIKKYDGRRKNNINTYTIDGDSTNWNRVECFYNKDSIKYCEENLLMVLRKRAGNYFIIQRRDKRAFECDYRGIVHYDENLLNEIIQDHKPLFDTLLKMVS